MSLSLSPADQLTAIQATTFFTDLKNQMKAIRTAMTTTGFEVNGWILTQVDQVPVKFELMSDGVNVLLGVGQDDQGNPLYSWNAPASWVSP